MHIIKEQVKLYVAFPQWNKLLKRIKDSTNRKIILIGTPVHGNLGDHAIAEQERLFFKEYFSQYEFYEILMPMYFTQKKEIIKCISNDDIVVMSGGGWMGNLWIHNENVIREVIKKFPSNKIIIMPQTLYYTDDIKGKKELFITKQILEQHNNLHIYTRDVQSFSLAKREFVLRGKSRIRLFPDMVLYGKEIGNRNINLKRKRIINVCIREDCESKQDSRAEIYNTLLEKKYDVRRISTVIGAPIKLKERMNKLRESWAQFSEASLTITDRLHAMLFSVINGTPCIILNNRTGKVFGVAEWIEKDYHIKKATSLEDVMEFLQQNDIWIRRDFNRYTLVEYFEEMANDIKED